MQAKLVKEKEICLKKRKICTGFGCFRHKNLLFSSRYGSFAEKHDAMDRMTERYFSALLTDDKVLCGDIPYGLDNLFYEKFGMSCEEVLKNCCHFIDIMT